MFLKMEPQILKFLFLHAERVECDMPEAQPNNILSYIVNNVSCEAI